MSNNEPLVSVVMPAYNARRTIVDSVKSLQMQSYRNWELFIVDDCSTDDTINIVRHLAISDERIKVISLGINSGRPAYPRNVAIREARGEIIAFLDADDEWMPDKLQKQLYFMDSTCAALSCTGYDVIDINGNDIGNFIPPDVCSYDDLLSNNTIGCLTAIYDVRILGKRYFPICGHEDYALWLNILRDGYEVYGLKDKLSRYRITPGSVSSSKLKILRFFWNIYRNQEKFSYLTSAFFCLRYAWNARGKYK